MAAEAPGKGRAQARHLAASAVGAGAYFPAAFALITVINCLLHAKLLRLPYFWDEAGYFVPAARDLFLSGDPIPRSVQSNAHPPLVMAWIALAWRMCGFLPAVSRVAMLIVSSFGLLGAYRVGSLLADRLAGVAAALFLGLYPIYFAQGSLVQLDLASSVLILWGLSKYLEDRIKLAAFFLTLAALSKETAVLAALGILAFESFQYFSRTPSQQKQSQVRIRISWPLITPCAALAAWFAYHYLRTSWAIGNPEYIRYNVSNTLSIRRIAAALLIQIWHASGYLNLFILTIPALCVWAARKGAGRIRANYWPLLFVCALYIGVLSCIGGAALARYMLPVSSLLVVLSVCILRAAAGVRLWSAATVFIGAVFAITLHESPPYHIALDDNLTYADFIGLHLDAARFLESRAGAEPILTIWPATDELMKPWLGYVRRPLKVFPAPDLSPMALENANSKGNIATVFVFSPAYQPRGGALTLGRYLSVFNFWNRARAEYFNTRSGVDPEIAASVLHGKIVWRETHAGLDAAVIFVARKASEPSAAGSNLRDHGTMTTGARQKAAFCSAGSSTVTWQL